MAYLNDGLFVCRSGTRLYGGRNKFFFSPPKFSFFDAIILVPALRMVRTPHLHFVLKWGMRKKRKEVSLDLFLSRDGSAFPAFFFLSFFLPFEHRGERRITKLFFCGGRGEGLWLSRQGRQVVLQNELGVEKSWILGFASYGEDLRVHGPRTKINREIGEHVWCKWCRRRGSVLCWWGFEKGGLFVGMRDRCPSLGFCVFFFKYFLGYILLIDLFDGEECQCWW